MFNHTGSIDRRTFIRSAGAAGLATAISPFGLAQTGPGTGAERIVVIGAGIVGSSIAYNLSKRGADVTLIDKRGPASQASGNSFAWINASYYDMPVDYYWLRTHSLNEYHRLQQEIDIPVRWGGSLEWYHSEERQAEVAAGVARIQGLGAPTWMIDPDRAADIEPNLDPGDVSASSPGVRGTARSIRPS